MLYHNQKTPISIYLECFRKYGVIIVANGSLTEYPGQHNHEEEVGQVKKEKMRRKLISAVKRDPTKILKKVYENVPECNPADPCSEYFSVETTSYRERSREVSQVLTSTGTLLITRRWARTLTGSPFLL